MSPSSSPEHLTRIRHKIIIITQTFKQGRAQAIVALGPERAGRLGSKSDVADRPHCCAPQRVRGALKCLEEAVPWCLPSTLA